MSSVMDYKEGWDMERDDFYKAQQVVRTIEKLEELTDKIKSNQSITIKFGSTYKHDPVMEEVRDVLHSAMQKLLKEKEVQLKQL